MVSVRSQIDECRPVDDVLGFVLQIRILGRAVIITAAAEECYLLINFVVG